MCLAQAFDILLPQRPKEFTREIKIASLFYIKVFMFLLTIIFNRVYLGNCKKRINPREDGDQMKWTVLLILTVLLLLDLVNGSLAICAFQPPDSTLQTSLTSGPQYDSWKVVSPYNPPSPDGRDISGQWKFQPTMLEGQSSLRMITYCNTGSSGGIPR